MLLTFEKRDASTLSLGPHTALRLQGGELRTPEDNRLVARHEKNHWNVRGEHYLRLDCEGPVTLTFYDTAGNASRRFGPYAHFSSVDGIGYRDHEVFCHLDEQTGGWYVRSEHREWPVLVLSDA